MKNFASFENAYSARQPEYGPVFAIGIGLNVIYVIVEFIYGFKVNSSALIADAGHNASDVLSLILSWVAIFLATKRPFGKYTYGLRRTTILAAAINGVLIILAAAFILSETIQKLRYPVEIPGDTIMKVAGVGILVNTITALLFIKGQKNDLNIKGTFLHMAADAAVSAGVLVGGLLMKLTGAYWIDSLLSFIIVAVIVFSAKGLLVDSIKLSVDAVPKEIDLEKVKHFLLRLDGVRQVHDLHIWALSTTETCLTAHLVVPEGCDDAFLYHIREMLFKEFKITHSTLQVQRSFVENEYEYHPV
jgi:cobalt-zinc-cadmium efflux system protein